MGRRPIFALTAALALVALAPISQAQRRGGFRGSPFARGGPNRNGSPFINHRRSDFPGAYLVGDPFFWDGEYSPPPPPPEPASPPLVLRGIVDTQPQIRLSPVLIELEGARYVRHGGTVRSAGDEKEPSGEPRTVEARQDFAAAGRGTQLPPAVLVFRDGHREEIPEYAIVGRVLYTHHESDDEPSYEMRAIQLSALDLHATINANRALGVRFVLPGPNEVVTRP